MRICCKTTYLKDIEIGEVFKVSNYSEDYFIKAQNENDFAIDNLSISVVNLITGVCSTMDKMKDIIKVNGIFIETNE